MLTDPHLAARAAASLPGDAADPATLLGRYFAAEQRTGRLRGDIDPGEAAVLVLVALFGLTTAPGARDAPGRAPAPSTRRMVELLLQGLAPP